MLIPRYYFTNEYKDFYEYFLSKPHTEKKFSQGEYLWNLDETIEKIYYIKSGIVQTYIEHEEGYRKIISFHGAGTVFPGYHNLSFKIEKSIVTLALSDVEVLEFSKEEFAQMLLDNQKLNSQMLDWYACYVNLLLYETAHQEYNSIFLKLCNLLYLFSQNSNEGSIIELTQENIASILAVNRVNAAKSLARLRDEGIIVPYRKRLEIIDMPRLMAYCSLETLQS